MGGGGRHREKLRLEQGVSKRKSTVTIIAGKKKYLTRRKLHLFPKQRLHLRGFYLDNFGKITWEKIRTFPGHYDHTEIQAFPGHYAPQISRMCTEVFFFVAGECMEGSGGHQAKMLPTLEKARKSITNKKRGPAGKPKACVLSRRTGQAEKRRRRKEGRKEGETGNPYNPNTDTGEKERQQASEIPALPTPSLPQSPSFSICLICTFPYG